MICALEEEALLRELEGTLACHTCGVPVKETWVYCPTCREQLQHACVSCGNLVRNEWDICVFCGTAQQPMPSAPRRPARNPLQREAMPNSPAVDDDSIYRPVRIAE